MTLYDPRKSGRISRIERDSGVKFEHLSAPQPIDIARCAGAGAVESITQVSDSVIPPFKSAAEELVNNSSLSAVELLAKALAKLSVSSLFLVLNYMPSQVFSRWLSYSQTPHFGGWLFPAGLYRDKEQITSDIDGKSRHLNSRGWKAYLFPIVRNFDFSIVNVFDAFFHSIYALHILS